MRDAETDGMCVTKREQYLLSTIWLLGVGREGRCVLWAKSPVSTGKGRPPTGARAWAAGSGRVTRPGIEDVAAAAAAAAIPSTDEILRDGAQSTAGHPAIEAPQSRGRDRRDSGHRGRGWVRACMDGSMHCMQ